MPRRQIISDDDILGAIVDLANRNIEPQTRLIRQELGNSGDYSRIQAVLDRWRAERVDERAVEVPETPDTVSRALESIWRTAYKTADNLLETKRSAFEADRLQFEGRHAEMMQEIANLEAARDAAEVQTETRLEELETLRETLEQIRLELAAERATTAELRRSVTRLEAEQQRTQDAQREERVSWQGERSVLETAKAALEVQAEQLRADLDAAKQMVEQNAELVSELRTALDTEREAHVAAEAQGFSLTQQLEAFRVDHQQAMASVQVWMERATTAEAALSASQVAPAPKKAAPRKRRASPKGETL